MPRSLLRSAATLLSAAALRAGLLVAVETSAQAAFAAPGGLAVANKNSSTPILKGEAQKRVKVKVRLTMFKKGKAVKVDPRVRVKPGVTYLLVLSTKIKDLRGNRLVATPAQTMARVLYRS